MKAFVFPGQGAQFEGMGKTLCEEFDVAKTLFHQADEILGFELSKVMFEGSAEELKQTNITQPAIFLHSVATYKAKGADIQPNAVAGHSLGEFSALVASGALNFEDGLKLVAARAEAMQKACEIAPSTMAAILGLEDEVVENICANIEDVVVPANYNCPGQLVISGSIEGIDKAVEQLKEAGARRALVLAVGGAFHSPMMEPARAELSVAIDETNFASPKCPIYQNVDAKPTTDSAVIKANLIAQLTAPVRWTQTMQNMISDGMDNFIEVGGTGSVIRGMLRKVDRKMPSDTL